MRKLIWIVAALLLPLAASAQLSTSPLYSYDWGSGNSYTTTTGYDGTVRLRGFNLNTGSTWRTTIRPTGDMTGWDSNNNYWRYNNSSKTYMNLGTGKLCVGSGLARICN